MSSPAESSKLFQRVLLGATLVISFVVVVLLRWLSEGPLGEAFSAAFEALFIAAFLALTVDPFLKREFFREASGDIFLFWLGYSLPHQINDFLHRFVMETKLLRKDCVLSWTLEDQPSGKVKLQLDVSYTFQNVTNELQRYQQQARVFDSSPDEHNEVLQMRCVAPGMPFLEYEWGPRDFQLMPDGFLAGPSCEIPPQKKLEAKLKSGVQNTITFGMKYASLHSEIASDSWRTAAPTMNLTIICQPADKFDFTTDLPNAVLAGLATWRWDGILLNGHGFNVSWKRRRP